VEVIGMISRIYVYDSIVKGMFIKEEDYLKVVGEKKNIEIRNKELEQNLIDKTEQYTKEKEIELGYYKDYIICLEKEKREKDEEIGKLKELNKIWEKAYDSICETGEKEIIKRGNDIKELKKQNEYYAKEYERLKDLYEPEKQYEEWGALRYYYIVDGEKKTYYQEMLLEDVYELIGMDSDNWIEFSVAKYEKEVK
jgi:hypothetical protein